MYGPQRDIIDMKFTFLNGPKRTAPIDTTLDGPQRTQTNSKEPNKNLPTYPLMIKQMNTVFPHIVSSLE